ncbi:MAG: trehalose-6-phosphate synthase [Nitrospirota bacterium]
MPSPSLVVASNHRPSEHRLAPERTPSERAEGGLTTALDPILEQFGETWVSWENGEDDRETAVARDGIEGPPNAPAWRLRRVRWSQEEKGGDPGYAAQVLWPLCHIALDRIAYRKTLWDGYVAANERSARAVLEASRGRPGLVWVRDFRLALLPRLIRAARPAANVAVFWPIPWPGPNVFRILPEGREVLEGLLAADSLVFQTHGAAKLFVDCARQFLNAEADEAGTVVAYQGHRTGVVAHPASVDLRAISRIANTPAVKRAMAPIRERLGLVTGVRLGLGLDRLDYTEGLLKRLWALETFFDRHAHHVGKFTFLLIGIQTRSEADAAGRGGEVVRQAVSEINGRFGRGGWRPIEYLEGRIGFVERVAYYRMAELALASSACDGMNLTAKEYVASQFDGNGLLLVSQMAGAAEELTDALVINPYDLEGTADAIAQALEMPTEERRRRMRAMRGYLRIHDIHAWTASCLREAGILPPLSDGVAV